MERTFIACIIVLHTAQNVQLIAVGATKKKGHRILALYWNPLPAIFFNKGTCKPSSIKLMVFYFIADVTKIFFRFFYINPKVYYAGSCTDENMEKFSYSSCTSNFLAKFSLNFVKQRHLLVFYWIKSLFLVSHTVTNWPLL